MSDYYYICFHSAAIYPLFYRQYQFIIHPDTFPNFSANRKKLQSDNKMADRQRSPIVIDNGSFTTKAGFAGDDKPCIEFPPVVGRNWICGAGMAGMNIPDHYVADEAMRKQSVLKLKRPIKAAKVDNWDDMEKIWNHTFYKALNIQSEQHPVLLSDVYYYDKHDMRSWSWKCSREKMTQIMFETFNVPSFYVQDQGVLALLSSGKSTGIVIDCGYETTRITPIYQGHLLKPACDKLNIGGINIDEYLQKLLMGKGYTFKVGRNFRVANEITDIKQKYGYVSLDIENESAVEMKYEMPDGNVISIGNERFECTEILFKPELIEMKEKGLDLQIINWLMKVEDMELKNKLSNNIFLNGGSSVFSNLSKRLQNELNKSDEIIDYKMVGLPVRKHSVWIGGSVLASLSTFSEIWIVKDEYDEYGPETVHLKCF